MENTRVRVELCKPVIPIKLRGTGFAFSCLCLNKVKCLNSYVPKSCQTCGSRPYCQHIWLPLFSFLNKSWLWRSSLYWFKPNFWVQLTVSALLTQGTRISTILINQAWCRTELKQRALILAQRFRSNTTGPAVPAAPGILRTRSCVFAPDRMPR